MVGQWASDPDLIAVDEFESQLAEGWTRKKKRRVPNAAEAQGSSKVSANIHIREYILVLFPTVVHKRAAATRKYKPHPMRPMVPFPVRGKDEQKHQVRRMRVGNAQSPQGKEKHANKSHNKNRIGSSNLCSQSSSRSNENEKKKIGKRRKRRQSRQVDIERNILEILRETCSQCVRNTRPRKPPRSAIAQKKQDKM
ncbi:hypothetical protein C8R44DRAFT_752906 [Mycena epipterygia]|nr:hypothetical protein C8R44DRAFT_752906 [Mycena epipterygia]